MTRFKTVPSRRPQETQFYSVAEVAALFGLSAMTVYRAIADGEFPAVKIRGRFIVPAKAVHQMIEAATASGSLVDPANWVPDDSEQ
jgi:excisionase family DNA binding protein